LNGNREVRFLLIIVSERKKERERKSSTSFLGLVLFIPINEWQNKVMLQKKQSNHRSPP
jgi:hypothetical protein